MKLLKSRWRNGPANVNLLSSLAKRGIWTLRVAGENPRFLVVFAPRNDRWMGLLETRAKHLSCTEDLMNQIPKTVVLLLLRGYKCAVSPLFLPACRYVPSCSEYAMEAVDRYGVARGGLMAIWRVLRCHPLAKGGLDPVVKSKMVKPNSSGVPAQRRRETELCSH